MDIAMAAVQLVHAAGAGAGAADDADIPTPIERSERPKEKRDKPRPSRTAGMSRIYIGAGRKNNLRPTDLVGAIVNEAKVEARLIGTIEITDKFALVELPEELVEKVVAALRASTIKGKRLTVRRDMAGGRRG